MTSFEDEEPDRPEFKGATIVSYIDGAEMTFYPPTEVASCFLNSQGVIASFIFAVLGVVTSIYSICYASFFNQQLVRLRARSHPS